MMQEIEFILHADGRVEERVLGVHGSDCTAVTKAIEQKLGAVDHTETTPDYYQKVLATQQVGQWS